MPESVCSDRLRELQAEILTLEASREQLLIEQEGAPQAPPQELLELTLSRPPQRPANPVQFLPLASTALIPSHTSSDERHRA